MRKLFLFFIVWILPLHPLFAADADFAHLIKKRSAEERVLAHFIEHINHVALNECDHEHSHKNDSLNPILHLVDFDHGLNFSMIPPSESNNLKSKFADQLPVFIPPGYTSLLSSPPIKPPYLSLTAED